MIPPREKTLESQELAHLYIRAAQEVGSIFGILPRSGGLSDANKVPRYVPTIDALGPLGGGAHTQEEWVSAESIRQRSLEFFNFLKIWFSKP